MSYRFLDASGRDAPTCRECGSLCVTRDGRVTCSACGYVAGTLLTRARESCETPGDIGISPEDMATVIAEARDEGHAAGRAEALEEAAKCARSVAVDFHNHDRLYHRAGAQAVFAALSALAGKL